jgi:hypothetical protein
MRAGLGRHRDAVHPGQFDQPDGKLVDDAERSLHRLDRLHRVHIDEPGHARDLFVEPWIVLHRAAAEREEAQIDAVILAA